MKQRSAFTLIELSVVLLVISALLVGVMKGGAMIEASRLDAARSYTSASPVANTPGLIAWYETSLRESLKPAEIVDGSQISAWYDISPNSLPTQKNTLTRTASSAVTLERRGTNGLPSIFFNGGILSLTAFYQGNLSPYNSFFIVTKPSSGSGSTKILFDSYSEERKTQLQYNKIGLWNEGGSAYVYTGTSTNAISIMGGLDYILTAIYQGSSSAVYQNSVGTLAGNGNLNITSNTETAGLTVGGNLSNSSGSTAYTGLISEVIIFDRPIKINERREIIKYLAKKYNIIVADI
jgi:prepilin-type N-terminal cleavage/methylation domain-containing protein